MTSTPNDVLTSLRDAANKENTQPLQADRIKAMLVHNYVYSYVGYHYVHAIFVSCMFQTPDIPCASLSSHCTEISN